MTEAHAAAVRLGDPSLALSDRCNGLRARTVMPSRRLLLHNVSYVVAEGMRRVAEGCAAVTGRAAITADGEGPDGGSVAGLLIRELDPNIGEGSTTAIFLTVPGTASQISDLSRLGV